MVTFERFFNSEIKARLIKFFIYNAHTAFLAEDMAKRLDLKPRSIRGALQELVDDGFLKSRTIRSTRSYARDFKCPYQKELRNIVLQFSAASHDKILENIKKIGAVKLAILGGVFLNAEKFRVDIFIVVDKPNESKLQKFLKSIEAEVGKEISYATMSMAEFKYRMDMFDRFVRDVLEFPNEKIINKLKV
ncbi:hypothetical protein HY249_02520 [Candidatus Azambacteria bacterium]|nr:hypothetical protein [Candidatus Azambacteria bacterium]